VGSMEMERTASLLWRLGDADARALAWIARRRSPTLVAFARGATRSGDGVTVILALATALVAWPGRVSALAAGSTILGLALFSLAKRLCNRPRPASVHMVLAAPDRFSLPSGHSTSAWAIAISVALAVPPLAAPILIWATLVAASRVVLGVHYPLDVVAGIVLGSLSALALATFV
jgi:undecaprenyl-diphosphatase